MALKRNERYPGRFDNPSTEHPQGAFKNRSAPNAKDGTYLERDWANDWDGFFAALLKNAGMTANGSIDTALSSQYFSALHEFYYLPVGIPLPWPTATPPAGWLQCDGTEFNKSDNPKLALAYPSGRLPDLRGEFIRGWDETRGVDPGRGLLTHQAATVIRTAALDYFGIDTTVDNSNIGTAFAEADTITKGHPNDARAPNNDVLSGGLLDNTIQARQLQEELTDGGVWISVRPRNLAFNYIVRAL